MSEQPVQPPEQEPAVRKSHIDLILALAAIFISAVSLAVAIRTEQSQRDTLSASIWPFLQRTISAGNGDKDAEMTIGISNDGVGPAKIRSIEIFYQGRPVSSTADLLRKCCGYQGNLPANRRVPEGFGASLVDNSVQRAGEENQMIRIRPSSQPPGFASEFRSAVMRLTFRGCYCSVRDQCWVSDLASTKTFEVAACSAPEFPFDPLGK